MKRRRKPRVANRDRRLAHLLAERDRLLVEWQQNTAEIAGLSNLGALLARKPVNALRKRKSIFGCI
jgi:hypothetical protein